MSEVAIVLSGCGVYDGTEVHEASAVAVSVARAGLRPAFYAPEKKQMHTINHLVGEPTSEERNVLVESARIARGTVLPLSVGKSFRTSVVFRLKYNTNLKFYPLWDFFH